ncbi:MAG: adenylate/guanylate cyclase domain-containing protein [Planctomycetota bacterium]|jgi:adenylate cyclase|nr:MAG: adenylate/guanylate cyclase domain-containing protein [Planctomycetota bacterium]
MPQNLDPSASDQLKITDVFSGLFRSLTHENVSNVEGFVENAVQNIRMVNKTLGMLNTDFSKVFEDLLQTIQSKICQLTSSDRTSIFLLDKARQQLWLMVEGPNNTNVEIRLPFDPSTIAGEVATSQKTINIPFDFFDDPRSGFAKKHFKQTGYRTYSMLGLPLFDEKGELVAVVELINKVKNNDKNEQLETRINKLGFTSADEDMFRKFSVLIAHIIESSNSFYHAAQKQRVADALMKAVLSVGQSLDLEDTLKTVMDQASYLLNADRNALWLIDKEKSELWTKVYNAGVSTVLRIPIGVGYAGYVAKTGEILNIPLDVYDHPDSGTSKQMDKKNGYRTCSLLCMPVFNPKKELIGVTQVVNKLQRGDFPPYDPKTWPLVPPQFKNSFTSEDVEFMKVFNTQAGIALENARLFEKIKHEQMIQKSILRSLSDGVISTDTHGSIIAANQKAYDILGFNKADGSQLEGYSIHEKIKIENANFSKWFNASLEGVDEKTRNQYYPDQVLNSHMNENHNVNVSINTMVDADQGDKVQGALVILEDISQEKRLKTTMYRYMTQELAEQLLADGSAKMGGDRKEVSVLFSDIRGYTSLSEVLSAEDVVSMLNEYFETMVESVLIHKGTLDKYIGDAIMAVFGTPLALPDHAWLAVQTAIDMRCRLKEFNAKRVEKLKPKDQKEFDLVNIKIGIGVNSDSVISGNIGCTKRMEFTSIGDGVNLGSRLEGTSKVYGTDIIISETTYKNCADRIWTRELDRIQVKGKNQPISIYEVYGLRSDPLSASHEQIIELYHKARDFYHQMKFGKAIGLFGEVLELDKLNKAASLHLMRCQHFLSNPPPADWDGVWRFTEK